MRDIDPDDSVWPDLPYGDWQESCTTLHLWTQIVGKIRLANAPWINHSWHVALYVTPRGLTTSSIPYGTRQFEISFDFIDHQLVVQESDGRSGRVALGPMAVAEFLEEVKTTLRVLDIDLQINDMPNEIAEPIRFSEDHQHAAYDAEYVTRFWRVLLQSDRVMNKFRAGFTGKCSPVHFFWGSFDLAVTRFSGRAAPEHPAGIPHLPDAVTREAYCREVSSAGFWPGGGPIDYPAYYSYAYPTPEGFSAAAVKPPGAFFDEALGEFLLPYDVVRSAADPDALLMSFLESTYAAAADRAAWDRAMLEREPVAPTG
jgi:hypothetical protein